MCWNRPPDAMSQRRRRMIETYGLSARCSDIGREPLQAAHHAGLEAMCGRGEMVDAADSKSAAYWFKSSNKYIFGRDGGIGRRS